MNRPRPRRGEVNVPALLGLILAILAMVTSFIPLCGGCVAVPAGCLALLLAIVGFATAKKQDSGTGLAAGATAISLLSILVSAGWWGWAIWMGAKENERQTAADAKVYGMNEAAYELSSVAWTTTSATQWNEPDKEDATIDVRVTGKPGFSGTVDSSQFHLVDESGARLEPDNDFSGTLDSKGKSYVLRFRPKGREPRKWTLEVTSPYDAHTRRFQLVVDVKEGMPEAIGLESTTREPVHETHDWDD